MKNLINEICETPEKEKRTDEIMKNNLCVSSEEFYENLEYNEYSISV